MNVWILIITVLTSDGKVVTDLFFPQTPQSNTEQSCKENGGRIANEVQLKLGTENAKVYFYCTPAPRSEFSKSLNGA